MVPVSDTASMSQFLDGSRQRADESLRMSAETGSPRVRAGGGRRDDD
jgi:hypothetical protein